MKTTMIRRLIIIYSCAGILFSCNKSNSSNNSTASSTTDLQTSSDDQTRVSTESDAAFDDVNTAMTSQGAVTGSDVNTGIRHAVIAGGGGDTVTSYICDATVTLDTTDNPHTLTITYNGANCALNRTRTGSVVVSWTPGVRWSTAGAVVTVAFQNLAITRLSDKKSITLNGTHTYTDVSGGSLLSLPNNPGTSITHTITSSDMSVTFDNNTKRSWSVARQRVYSFSDGYIITTTGTNAVGSTTGISEWGTDRFGNTFQTIIAQPRVISQSCSWQMTSGEVQIANSAGTTSVTYGLNATGGTTSCPIAGGTYYFMLSWTAAVSGKTYSFILPY
jgi:hypothetical protein